MNAVKTLGRASYDIKCAREDITAAMKVESVERLNLEALAGTNRQERFVAGIECVLAGQIARDALHGKRLLSRVGALQI